MSIEEISNEGLPTGQPDGSLIDVTSAGTDISSFSISIEAYDSSDLSESDSAQHIQFYSRTLGQTKTLDLADNSLCVVESKKTNLMALIASFITIRDPLTNPKFYNYPSLEFFVDPIHIVISKAIEGSSGPKARMSAIYTLSALQCDPSLFITEHALQRTRLETLYPLFSWVPQRSKAYFETMLPVNMNRHLGIQSKLCMSQSLYKSRDASLEEKKNEEDNDKTRCIRVEIGDVVHPFEKITDIPRLNTTLLSQACINNTNEPPVIVEFVCPVCSMELNVDEIVKEILMEQDLSLLERHIKGLDLSDPDFPKDKCTLSKIKKATEINIHEAVSFLRREVSGLLKEYFCRHLAKEKLRLQGIMSPDEIMEGQYRIFILELKRRLAKASLFP